MLWLCGITQNQRDNIDELTKDVWDLVDGLVWVDHGSDDGTLELLEDRKKDGEIIPKKWINAHDISMNGFLLEGPIQHGDWVFIIDSQERINPQFVLRLTSGMLKNFEDQQINTVYQRSKPLLFKFHDDQMFAGSPHWGISGMRNYMVDISKFDGFADDKDYVWSKRDDINKWITNGIKYYYIYGRSNHLWLVYGKQPQDVIARQEGLRHDFRHYCRHELNLPLVGSNNDILKALETFMLENDPLPPKFIDFMKKEKVIANFYRYVVRKEDQKYIYDTQDSWVFDM